LTMTDGTITGGQGGSGGGLYLYKATANLDGGTIYGNSGTYGGNVHTAENGTTGCLNVGNVNVYGGTASGGGADYWVSSTGKANLAVKEATIKDAAGKNVITTAGDMVLYVNGVYTVHDHTMVTDAAVAPDCNNTGLTEGKHCTGCDTQTVAQEEVAALGHAYEGVYTAPTFEADGFTTYTCGNCGDTYTETEEGTQLHGIVITAQPVDAAVEAAQKAQFTISALSQSEELTYRWQYQRPGGTKWFNTTMEGYATETLTVSATLARNGYRYRVIVTDGNGNEAISEIAILTVTEKTITTSGPEDQVAENGKAVFTVNVEGENLTYKWQYQRPGSTKWFYTTMTGHNTNQLTVTATKARNGYKYRCIVSDSYGNETVSETATLTVE